VYAVGKAAYGCSSRTGRVTRLGSTGFCVGSQRIAPVTVIGELTAYGLETCGVDTGSSQIVVRRLSDARVLLTDPATTNPLGPESYSSVSSLVMRPDGAVAWIGVGNSIIHHSHDVEVHKATPASQSMLDSGASIEPSSLRLNGARLTWRHGSATRTASLR
jgi:hypothetical protein